MESPGRGPSNAAASSSVERREPVPVSRTAPVLARQPLAGLITLIIVSALIALVGILPDPERLPLQVLGPITLFWLPVLLAMGYWWTDAPPVLTRRPLGGGLATVLSLAVALVLTAIAQLVVGRLDLEGMFSTAESAGAGTFTTYPYTVPLALAVAVAMFHVTFLWDRWPFRRLTPLAGGAFALAFSWLVGLLIYLGLANWDAIPEATRTAIGLRNPGGPWDGFDLLGLLVSILVWQALFGVLFDGFPFTAFRGVGSRAWASAVLVVLLGVAKYLIWRHGVHFPNGAVAAIGGSGVAAAFILRVALERWPFQGDPPGAARLGLFATGIVAMATIYFALRASGNEAAFPPIGFWIGVSSIGFIAAGIVWFDRVWRRWPLPEPALPSSSA